jgi:hypothetical protein
MYPICENPVSIRQLIPFPGNETIPQIDPRYLRFVENWFFSGADAKQLIARPSVPRSAAIRHISQLLHSFELKHEVKIGNAAYLLHEWFTIETGTL